MKLLESDPPDWLVSEDLSRPSSAASSITGRASTSGQPFKTSTAQAPSVGSVGTKSHTPIGTETSLVSH